MLEVRVRAEPTRLPRALARVRAATLVEYGEAGCVYHVPDADAGALVGAGAETLSAGGASVLVRLPVPEDCFVRTARAHGGVLALPVHVRDGCAHARFLYAERGQAEAALRALGADVALEGIAEVPTESLGVFVPAASLVAELTPRQVALVQAAVERGYYDVPRGVALSDLARAAGITRATYQEHLRKAERALLRAFASLLGRHAALAAAAARRPGRPRQQARTRT